MVRSADGLAVSSSFLTPWLLFGVHEKSVAGTSILRTYSFVHFNLRMEILQQRLAFISG